MRGDPTTFWGKYVKGNEGAPSEWHPLVDHCADVAAVVETLVHLPVWRARIRDLATFENPHQFVEGTVHVLVNGRFAVRDGEDSGVLAGVPLTPPR